MRPSRARVRRCALFLTLTIGLSGCRQNTPAAPPAPPRVLLNTESPRPTIDVVGVPAETMRALPASSAPEAWRGLLTVSSGSDSHALRGQVTMIDGGIRFTPMFPLDRGRPYRVTFAAPGAEPVTATVSFPLADTVPTTSVLQSFPSTATVPSNVLRLHVMFSAPMATRDVGNLVRLVDSGGADRTDLLLPLDADAWNVDRTRCTLVVDPARRGALLEGELYTLVIEPGRLDSHGLPLKQPYRRVMTIGPPDEAAIDPGTWQTELPAAGSTRPLVIIFPESLDYESLTDAISITGPDRKPVAGQTAIGAGESAWTFVPDDPWQAGAYAISVAKSLSDPAGNSVGLVFDAEMFDRTSIPDPRPRVVLPVTIR